MKKFGLLFSLLLAVLFYAHAQKLPNVQIISVEAPSKVSVDGNAAEWRNAFNAYNKSTGVLYTIANDRDYLYLLIRADDKIIIEKALQGGITFTITTSIKNQVDGRVTLSFPAQESTTRSIVTLDRFTKDSLSNRLLLDSLRDNYNKQIAVKLKAMAVTGAAGIPNGLLSVYNDEGLKAASAFNHQLQYTCELAIPLKILPADISKYHKLTYNIKLNSVANGAVVGSVAGRDDILGFMGADGVHYVIGHVSPETLTLAYPTDFWGEYTLAKKP